MKTNSQRSKVVYLTDQNYAVLNLSCNTLVMSQSDLFRYVITKAKSYPKQTEQEFDCPGLANKIREAVKASRGGD